MAAWRRLEQEGMLRLPESHFVFRVLLACIFCNADCHLETGGSDPVAQIFVSAVLRDVICSIECITRFRLFGSSFIDPH